MTQSVKRITKEQFERRYAKRSGLTVKKLHALTMHAYPCVDCDYPTCEGWKMLSDDSRLADTDFEAWKAKHALPQPSERP